MRSHPEIGLSLLGDGRSRRELLAVLYHHERLDGTGYPYGLGGEAIPIEARIVAARYLRRADLGPSISQGASAERSTTCDDGRSR